MITKLYLLPYELWETSLQEMISRPRYGLTFSCVVLQFIFLLVVVTHSQAPPLVPFEVWKWRLMILIASKCDGFQFFCLVQNWWWLLCSWVWDLWAAVQYSSRVGCFGLFKASLSLRLNFMLSDVCWYCHQRPVTFSAITNLWLIYHMYVMKICHIYDWKQVSDHIWGVLS